MIQPRTLDRKRKAALIEGFGPCTDEYIQLLRYKQLELESELERVRELLEKRK